MMDKLRMWASKIGWGVPSPIRSEDDRMEEQLVRHEREQDLLIAAVLRDAQALSASAKTLRDRQ